MTETGKVFLRYLYKRFGWKVIHHRKKLFRIIHKRAFETSMKKLKFVIFTNAPCKGLNSNFSLSYEMFFCPMGFQFNRIHDIIFNGLDNIFADVGSIHMTYLLDIG